MKKEEKAKNIVLIIACIILVILTISGALYAVKLEKAKLTPSLTQKSEEQKVWVRNLSISLE